MEQLVSFIIRPPRAEYSPNNDLLDQEFMLKGKWYQRKDIEVKNGRGDILQCSHYLPLVSPEEKALPCVIYCHGNSGCRADASEAAIILLSSNITVFTLDFAGSGLSGGEHVSLGWHEKDDLRAVVDYLRADGNISFIGLWGRSMGAVTSLMYGAEDPSIAGMVLDSPFSDLVELMMELVDTYKFRLPKFTVKFAIQYMRRVIQKKAKFDIMDLNTIKVAKSCFVPVLFGHAIDDDFIRPLHSERIYEAYVGDKNIIKFEGDHNSPRPQFYFDSINIFFHNVLQPPEDEVGPTFYDPVHDYFGKGSWSTMHEMGYLSETSAASKVISAELATSSTADAINQVRSKRPMSRMEVPSDVPSKESPSEAKEKHSDDDDGDGSSSKMISFELSNGDPYGPHVPTAVDDDQYVEYQLEDLSGFPCSVEEEERMLMEAVIKSLKDLEMPHPPHPQVEEKQPSSSNNSLESAEKDDPHTSLNLESSGPPSSECSSTPVDNSSSKKEDCCSRVESSSTPVDNGLPSLTDSIATSVITGCNLAPEPASPDTFASSAIAAFDSQSPLESASTLTSSSSDTSASMQSLTDVQDMSANTKATVTVVKNPTNHIMDGLMRRWDLNFFRNR